MNKKLFKELWDNYKHLTILLYYGVLMLLYSSFNQFIEPKYMMHSFLDDYIPFMKIFVVPYVYWYLYIALPMVYFAFKDKDAFLRLAIFMFGGMTICYVIYYIFPNGQDLRPVLADQDIFSRAIKTIWATDRPTNVAPSMHVLDSVAVHLAIVHSHLKEKKWIRYGSLISAILISMSTVMIKQHSILDVLYALILSSVLYVFIFRTELVKKYLIRRGILPRKDKFTAEVDEAGV